MPRYPPGDHATRQALRSCTLVACDGIAASTRSDDPCPMLQMDPCLRKLHRPLSTRTPRARQQPLRNTYPLLTMLPWRRSPLFTALRVDASALSCLQNGLYPSQSKYPFFPASRHSLFIRTFRAIRHRLRNKQRCNHCRENRKPCTRASFPLMEINQLSRSITTATFC